LSLNTTRIKQHGFTWVPQVFLSTHTLPLTLCRYLLSISALLAFVSIIQWLLSQSTLVCSSSLLGSLASGLCLFKPPLSINQSCCNVFRDGGHLFCNEGTINAFKIPKIVVPCLQRSIHKNTGKFTKLPFIGPEISLILPYNHFGFAFGHYRK